MDFDFYEFEVGVQKLGCQVSKALVFVQFIIFYLPFHSILRLVKTSVILAVGKAMLHTYKELNMDNPRQCLLMEFNYDK